MAARAAGLSLHLWFRRELGPSPSVILGSRRPSHSREEALPSPPRLREGLILRAPKRRPPGSAVEKAVSPRGGAGPQLSLTSLMSLSGASSKRLRTCSRLSAWRICSRRTCGPSEESRGPRWANVAPPPPSRSETRLKEERGPGRAA